jgi:hypothetical protein
VVKFVNCEWEGCLGVELKITGFGGANPGDDIQVMNSKFERAGSSNTYVLLDLNHAQNCKFVGNHFYTPSNAHFVDQKNTDTGYPHLFSGCGFISAGAAPTYFIDQSVGGIILVGCSLISSVAAPTAFWNIATGVGNVDYAAANHVNYPAVMYADARTPTSGQPMLPPVGGFKTVTYTTPMTPNCNEARVFIISATNTSAFTIANPTNPKTGLVITIDIGNLSGGALGTITWDSEFLLAGAFTAPANGKSRTIQFYRNAGSKWLEVGRAAADIG